MGHTKRVTAAQIARACELRKAGVKVLDIAADINLNLSTVSKLLNDDGYRLSRMLAAQAAAGNGEPRMKGRHNPAAGPQGFDPIAYANQNCPSAMPLIRRIRGMMP